MFEHVAASVCDVQRFHWYAYELGLFVQLPWAALIVSRDRAVPVMVGRDGFAGAGGGGVPLLETVQRAVASTVRTLSVTRMMNACGPWPRPDLVVGEEHASKPPSSSEQVVSATVPVVRQAIVALVAAELAGGAVVT